MTEDELGNWRPERNRFSKSYITEYCKNMPPAAPVEDFDDRNALYALQADPFNDQLLSFAYLYQALQLARCDPISCCAQFPRIVSSCFQYWYLILKLGLTLFGWIESLMI